MNIKLPFNICLVGISNCGKTTLIFNMLTNLPHGTFDKVYLFTDSKNKPLHMIMEQKFNKDYFEIVESEKIDKFDFKYGNTLYIVDANVDLSKFEIVSISSRVNGSSCIFMSHAYYLIPNVMRKNCTHLMIMKIFGEIELISRDIGIDKEVLKKMLSFCKESFMYINMYDSSNERFYKGFNQILNIDDFN